MLGIVCTHCLSPVASLEAPCSTCGSMPTPVNGYDVITRPEHYAATAIEPLDVIEDWGLNFALGNVVKYVRRADLKGQPILDLEKARQYLDREIARRRKAAK